MRHTKRPPTPAEPEVAAKHKIVVRLGGPLMSAAGGETEFEVEAATIQDMLNQLGERYPALRPVLAKSVSVAVDGHVYRGAWQKPLRAGAEVFLLPPMQGG